MKKMSLYFLVWVALVVSLLALIPYTDTVIGVIIAVCVIAAAIIFGKLFLIHYRKSKIGLHDTVMYNGSHYTVNGIVEGVYYISAFGRASRAVKKQSLTLVKKYEE